MSQPALKYPNYQYSHQDTLQLLEFEPAILTAGTVEMMTVTCRLRYCRISNPTSGNVTISVQDLGDTPVYVIPPTVLPPGGIIIMSSNEGDLCPNGASITTDTDGVHAYARATIL